MATKTKAKAKTSRRTTHRSSKGTKLYAVRAADGTFKDIQSYKRAHAADLKRKSTAETAKKKTTGAKKKKTGTRKKAAKKK
jgi:DNA-binding protein HU-beta